MKWEKESRMKDGTKIRIDDWSEDYSCFNPFSQVAAYPICKRTIGQFIREGQTMRLEINFKNREEAEKAYEKLLSGEASFTDYLANIDRKYHKAI